jgi:hypothetical protein
MIPLLLVLLSICSSLTNVIYIEIIAPRILLSIVILVNIVTTVKLGYLFIGNRESIFLLNMSVAFSFVNVVLSLSTIPSAPLVSSNIYFLMLSCFTGLTNFFVIISLKKIHDLWLEKEQDGIHNYNLLI